MAHLIGYKMALEINDQYMLESATYFRRKPIATKEATEMLNEYAATCVSYVNNVFDADFDILDITECTLFASDGKDAEIYDVSFARVVESKIDIIITTESDDAKLLHIRR